ncbi:MAG: cell division protein FtsL [Alphaproteobacteria bacterium]
MKRWWIVGLLVIAGLAVGLYRAKLGAQENETRIAALKTEIGKTAGEVSVLKADEAYLSRPERIGPLARERLGLQPAAPDQFTAPEMISKRVGEERASASSQPAPPKKSAAPAPLDKKPVVSTTPVSTSTPGVKPAQ